MSDVNENARKTERNAEIRRLFEAGALISHLARQFAISNTRVSQILRRPPQPTWKTPLYAIPPTHILHKARATLAAEIKAAREEAATAPLYRTGPW